MAHRMTSFRLTDAQKALWKQKAADRRLSKNEYLRERLRELSENEISSFARTHLGPGEGRRQTTFPLSLDVAERLDDLTERRVVESRAAVLDALIGHSD